MIVKDIIKANDLNTEVMVNGVNPADDCDPLTEIYYHGKLGEIPEDLQSREVVQTSCPPDSQCLALQIPYIKPALFSADECHKLIEYICYVSDVIETISYEMDSRTVLRLNDTLGRLFEIIKLAEMFSDVQAKSEDCENKTLCPIYNDDHSELIHSGIYVREYENGKSMSMGVEILLPTIGKVAQSLLEDSDPEKEWHVEDTYSNCYAIVHKGKITYCKRRSK